MWALCKRSGEVFVLFWGGASVLFIRRFAYISDWLLSSCRRRLLDFFFFLRFVFLKLRLSHFLPFLFCLSLSLCFHYLLQMHIDRETPVSDSSFCFLLHQSTSFFCLIPVFVCLSSFGTFAPSPGRFFASTREACRVRDVTGHVTGDGALPITPGDQSGRVS